MVTTRETLAMALALQGQGMLDEAAACCRRAFELNPHDAEIRNGYADACYRLGNALKEQQRLDEAVACYQRALELTPDFAEVHNNLGNVLKDQGQIAEAAACYRRALRLRPDYAGLHNNLGVALLAQGQLDEAIACYRQALQRKPDHAGALSNLGNALQRQGRLEEAVACYQRALQVNPDYADVHKNLGIALQVQGRTREAIACYQRALQLRPDFPDALHRLGTALQGQGMRDQAAACYQRALELKPDYADTHNNLGVVLADQGRLAEAAACYRRALELKPDYAEALGNLGIVLKDQGQLAEAAACYRRAIALKPENAGAHNALGMVLQDQGELEEALACYQRALTLRPDFAEAHNNLGNVRKDRGQLAEAIACYRRARELKPDFAEAHSNLAVALKDEGKLDEALACCRRALELKPNFAEAHNTLGNALKDEGMLDEAVACYRRALELKPDWAKAHSNLLLTLQYCTGVTPVALAEAHAEYDRRHAAPLRSAFAGHEKVRDTHGRLRLGFVSPDLGAHPVGYFLVRVLENLSHQENETICYSDRTVKDGLTRRFQAAATQWRDVTGMSDQRLTEQIRADRIDVLFDLAGHTCYNRLLAFARKPAPIQITWIGYEGTTGLAAMDFLLADRHVVPEGTEHYYREHVLRMPDGYLCYDPPDAAPPVGPLPSLKTGHVTFGSFNNLAKITPEVVAVWAKILRRVPTARLVLKYGGLGDPVVKRRYFDLFAAHGVEPQRLELLPPSPYAEYLAMYQQVDVALDPFPFSGSATTCEALWMGVPVITCPLETFVSRHSLSHLSSVGLTETIARDLGEYVELAVSLAGDLPRLAVLRAGLRQRMAASPLCDGKRFAAHLASLLHDVWDQSIG